ncbi:MAG: hypothetical protein GY938_31805 [Ketobacter sp.]|nr:hypothetical protein [Ketobacter sp.]
MTVAHLVAPVVEGVLIIVTLVAEVTLAVRDAVVTVFAFKQVHRDAGRIGENEPGVTNLAGVLLFSDAVRGSGDRGTEVVDQLIPIIALKAVFVVAE